MKEKNKRVRHLGRKVNVLVFCLMVISIAVMVAVCVYMFRQQTMRMLENRCVNGTNMLAYQLQHYDPDDKQQLLEDLKEEMRCEFTIFEGDTRTFTTLEGDSNYAVGSKLSEDLAEIVLKQGKTYIGEVETQHTKYLCSYVPINNNSGLVFAGVSMETANGQIDLTLLYSCAAGATLVLISILLMSIFITRSISRPLGKITTLAKTIEAGNLGLKEGKELTVDINSNDEIGVLGGAFENTILRLRNYIGEISSILDNISHGDLTASISQDYVGDFASIKDSLDGILQNLNSTMSQIAESSDHVSNGSDQMSMGAQALSQGAVEQSSAVDELDETMQNVSKHVGETAQNAQEASENVARLSEQISESNQKMQEMIRAMQEINDSSDEIGKIIKTIENIALQTNILSLNSAVEASRAGEAGKGFAVVAQEVRELAGRSSEASQSTAALIERSMTAVEYGTKIANETAKQLSSVVESANQIAETTSQIADASQTQAKSVSQIQERISQISNVVQTNSATAEESAATSEELSEQAKLLKRLIDMFHLKK